MIDTHRIVDEIRVFLQGADRTNSPRLKELAQRYADACAEANERLSRCLYFLRQGLRSEAIQFADTPPPIMDVLAVLDFPERAEWEELALAYDWPSPAALALDSAQALNEAYAQEDPLRELMRAHRLLALSRAPIADRLAILRRIAQVDVNNSVWQDDVRTFEKARLGQLAEDLRRVVAAQDLAGAKVIVAELNAPDWLEKPTAAQQEAARAALGSVRQSAARSSLAALLPRLLETIGTIDLAAAQAVRARWQTLAQEAALRPNEPLAERAEPALQWISATERAAAAEVAYERAVRDVEDALDSGAPRPFVESLERAVWALERDLPSPVEARVKAYYARHERRARMAVIGLATAATTVLLFVAWIALWFYADAQKRQAIDGAVSRVQDCLKRGEVEAARKTRKELLERYPDTAGLPALTEAFARVEAAEHQEQARAKQFADGVKAAQLQAGLTEDGPEIRALRALMRGPVEAAAVERLAADARAAASRDRTAADAEIHTLVDTYATRVGALENAVKVAPLAGTVADDVRSLKLGVSQIKPLVPKASDRGRQEAEALIGRFETAERAYVDSEKRSSHIKTITKVVRAGMPSEALQLYVKHCESYRAELPRDRRSTDFGKALEQVDTWKATLDWNGLVAGWGGTIGVDQTSAANARLAQIRKFQEQTHQSLNQPTVADYQAFLEAFLRSRDESESSPRRELAQFLAGPVIASVWKVVTKQGKVYYTPREPKPNSYGLAIDYFLDRPIPGNPNTRRFTITNGMGYLEPEKAPQTVIAARANQILSRMSAASDGWEWAMAEILRLIRNDRDLDPVLQVAMLSRVMHAASRGSTPMQEALKGSVAAIEDADLNLNARWMDPDDLAAQLVRSKARVLVQRLPLLDTLPADAKRVRDALAARVAATYHPAGWLCRDDTGVWRCLSLSAPQADDELWVLAPEKIWHRVGRGSAVNPRAGAGLLVEGRLLFVRRTGS